MIYQIPREDDGGLRIDDIVENSRQGQLTIELLVWQREEDQRKGFNQYCLKPNSSKHFLYFRAIQGQSEGNLVDPALQDNVLLPEHFTECICHVGNVSDIHSIIRSGLISGGKSLKRDRQSVFFTAVNPMDDDQSMKEIRCDLDKPRIAPYKNIWRLHCKYGILVQLKARSEERIAILSNTITRNRSLQRTTCDLYWESGVHED